MSVEFLPESDQQAVEPAVDVKRSGEVQGRRNLRRRATVLESQGEQELISGVELREAARQGPTQLGMAHGGIGQRVRFLGR